ncbi:hypothetical protein Syun_026811 [Stephania yunnanensis]|uniref:Uncharacterized protein n=1 Tax=Stephania yunnanensis TaxID=152371 RepID=A0AAP0EEH3_9MAGN
MDSSYGIVKLKPKQAQKYGRFVVDEHNKKNGTSLIYESIDEASVKCERCRTDDRYRFTVYVKQAGAREAVPYEATLKDKQPGSNSGNFELRSFKRKATCYPSFMEKLSADATTVESRVQLDGQVVTSLGVGAAMEYVVALVERLYGKEKAMSYGIVKLKPNQANKYGRFVVDEHNKKNGESLIFDRIDEASVKCQRCGTDDRYRFTVYVKQGGAREGVPYEAILKDKQPGSNSANFEIRSFKRKQQQSKAEHFSVPANKQVNMYSHAIYPHIRHSIRPLPITADLRSL